MVILSLEEINKLDIVDFLASIGIHPKQTNGHLYLYRSPLPGMTVTGACMTVNRKLNLWWDSGSKEGSTLVDFGARYYNCTIRELKERLSCHMDVSHNYPMSDTEAEQKMQVLTTYPIRSFYLLHYLWQRRIPIDVAHQYCVEAQFTFGPQPYYAIGFRNNGGGYELRNRFHKYTSLPKAPTLVNHNAKDIAIFQGFFDMLTFVTFTDTPVIDLPDLLVLNSRSYLDSSMPPLGAYRYKHLFLGNDPVGEKLTRLILARESGYLDHRSLYNGYNDLNNWVCHFGKAFIPPFKAPVEIGP